MFKKSTPTPSPTVSPTPSPLRRKSPNQTLKAIPDFPPPPMTPIAAQPPRYSTPSDDGEFVSVTPLPKSPRKLSKK